MLRLRPVVYPHIKGVCCEFVGFSHVPARSDFLRSFRRFSQRKRHISVQLFPQPNRREMLYLAEPAVKRGAVAYRVRVNLLNVLVAYRTLIPPKRTLYHLENSPYSRLPYAFSICSTPAGKLLRALIRPSSNICQKKEALPVSPSGFTSNAASP